MPTTDQHRTAEHTNAQHSNGPSDPSQDPRSAAAPTRTAAPLRELVAMLEGDAALDRHADALGRVAERVAQGRRRDVLLGVPLGHALHPILSDLPLACWTCASLLDLLGARSSGTAAQRLVGIGLIASAPTTLSGLTEFGELRRTPDRRVATVHAGGNVVGMTLQALSWRARRRDHRVRGVLWTLAGNVVLSATGYLGGHLAFARGAGVQDRSHPPSPRAERSAEEQPLDPGELLTPEAAAAVLGVTPDRVPVMVQEGLLTPAGPDGGFLRSDVEAARLLGG